MGNQQNLLESFIKNIKWEIISKIFGNTHSAFIGLVSCAWILSDKNREAFGELSYRGGRNKKWDAVLIENNEVKGIVEVEGDIEKVVKKMHSFFNSQDEYYSNLEFVLLFAYPLLPSSFIPQKDNRVLPTSKQKKKNS